MNIKTRIKKLEANSDIETNLCTCSPEIAVDVLLPDPHKSEADRELEIADWQKPKYCDICAKQIDRQMIEIVWTNDQPKRIESFA